MCIRNPHIYLFYVSLRIYVSGIVLNVAFRTVGCSAVCLYPVHVGTYWCSLFILAIEVMTTVCNPFPSSAQLAVFCFLCDQQCLTGCPCPCLQCTVARVSLECTLGCGLAGSVLCTFTGCCLFQLYWTIASQICQILLLRRVLVNKAVKWTGKPQSLFQIMKNHCVCAWVDRLGRLAESLHCRWEQRGEREHSQGLF